MPHDGPEHWHEITGNTKKAGFGQYQLKPFPYDIFMEEQGIPVVRDIGISKVQNLPLKPWSRMGGRGSFIQLFGTEGLWGCYLAEVPGAGALTVERHIYEEVFFVVEGRGSTEIWVEGGRKHVFEWAQGSMFAIPANAYHRIVNAASSPALLLAGTSAPAMFNLYDDEDFIFNNGHVFRKRFDDRPDYFEPNDNLAPDPHRGLAQRRSNLLPDIVNCDLPLDNRRSLGYRRIEPDMAGNKFYLFIGEHETGRYSKAHSHPSTAVLICLKGKGYTYTWPASAGVRPWESGNADMVRRVDYEPVGMVSAAPMAGDWFHQHFGVSKEPLRLTAWMGALAARQKKPGVPGEVRKDLGSIDLRDGGSAIPYDEEDPFVRTEYEANLARIGAVSRMDPDYYVPGNEKGKAWGSAVF